MYGYDIGSGWLGRVDDEEDVFMEFCTEEEYKDYLKEEE